MSDRTKDLILKTLLVIGVVLMFMFFPGGIIISFLVPDQKTFDIFYNTIFFTVNNRQKNRPKSWTIF